MKLSGIALLGALALAGCGSMGTSSSAPSTPTQAADGTMIGPTGKTLYFFAKDVKGSGASECYDACATNWPPLAVAETAKPIGDYNIIIRNDGKRQWAYKGQPLYYFVKDAKVGDKTGDGVGGNWKVAKP
ncbi:COG4315 family predicted lipoprotein [Ottowia thiooxydans]|uniref:COG4315 family predicted lipoprotein n=1 Tax=Ottowia thiooxydans TaxID=219182 RepID=UPI00041109E3|nr:ATP-binding protein [Ottowia thiooxydans]